MGFIIHFYIIFGTNLLTQSPVPVSVFFVAYFRVSKKRKIKRSPIDLKLHGTHFWKERSPEDLECTSGDLRGGHEAGGTPPWARPPPSWALHGPPDVLLPPIYLRIP